MKVSCPIVCAVWAVALSACLSWAICVRVCVCSLCCVVFAPSPPPHPWESLTGVPSTLAAAAGASSGWRPTGCSELPLLRGPAWILSVRSDLDQQLLRAVVSPNFIVKLIPSRKNPNTKQDKDPPVMPRPSLTSQKWGCSRQQNIPHITSRLSPLSHLLSVNLCQLWRDFHCSLTNPYRGCEHSPHFWRSGHDSTLMWSKSDSLWRNMPTRGLLEVILFPVVSYPDSGLRATATLWAIGVTSWRSHLCGLQTLLVVRILENAKRAKN